VKGGPQDGAEANRRRAPEGETALLAEAFL